MGSSASKKAVVNSDTAADEAKKKKDEESKKYPAGSLSIYFGSQTGTAEGFSRTLMEEGKAAGFNAKVIDLEDFNADTLIHSTERAIFLMATYGEGEATDNATQFARWLKEGKSDLEPDVLKALQYTVFGLGNKQYEHFNLMGKVTNKGLADLGAQLMFEYGEGDDDGTMEEDFESWKVRLWPALTKLFHPHASSSSSSIDAPPEYKKKELIFTVKELTASGDSKTKEIHASKMNTTTKHFFTAPRAEVIQNKELRTIGGPTTTSSCSSSNIELGSTRHVEIDLKSVQLSYVTADNLAVLPENNLEYVELLAKAQGYDLNQVFEIEPTAENRDEFKYAFPTPCTVRDVLTLYLDIQGPIKQSVLKHLVPYVTDAKQLEWLKNVISQSSIIKQLVDENNTSLFDLLIHELDSCKIPLVDFLHIVPYIQPRFYTISSSSSCHPDIVHITISITAYKLKSGKVFTGLTSGFIKNLQPRSSKCRVFVRASSFRLPKSIDTPIIMVGPGTGLAPMRALLQERGYLKEIHGKIGLNVLFFGCKNQSVDYIYRDELENFEKSEVLNHFYKAFSRDSTAKEYVQHLMIKSEISPELMQLIDAGAYVYVCGATAMGADVMATFQSIVQKSKNINPIKAVAYVKEMQEQGRYIQELWTA